MTTDLPRGASPVPALWGAAAALLMIAPWFSVSPFAADYDAQRLLAVAAWALLVGAAVGVPSVRAACLRAASRLPRWASVGALAFVGIGCASAWAAPRPVWAFAEVASVVMMGMTAVAAASAGRDGARRGLAVVAVLALGGYAAVVLGFHARDLWHGADAVWPRRHLGFGHVRHFNQLQAWTLPLVWALAAVRPSGAARWGLRALGAVQVALVVASFGRGIVVALAAGVVVAALTVRVGRRALLREAAVAVAAGLALWALLFADGPTVAGRLDAGSNGRAALWAAALRMIGAHPALGVGPMHYAYYPAAEGAHPHNAVLQIAAEWGAPAALVAVALALGAGACWLRHARAAGERGAAPREALWAAGLTAGLTAALANALVDGFVVAPTSQAVAALAVGALLAEATARRPPRPVRLAASAPLGALACASLAVLLAVAASDLPGLHRAHYDLRFAHVGPADTPRFWLCGKLAGVVPADAARFWPEAPPEAPRAAPPPVAAAAR